MRGWLPVVTGAVVPPPNAAATLLRLNNPRHPWKFPSRSTRSFTAVLSAILCGRNVPSIALTSAKVSASRRQRETSHGRLVCGSIGDENEVPLLVQSHHLRGMFEPSFHEVAVEFGATGQNVDDAIVPQGWTIGMGGGEWRRRRGQRWQIERNEGSVGFDSGNGSGGDLAGLIGLPGEGGCDAARGGGQGSRRSGWSS